VKTDALKKPEVENLVSDTNGSFSSEKEKRAGISQSSV
jgi:hypothetical protein